MEVRRYRYDPHMATKRESLARMLKRCKLEDGVVPVGRTIKFTAMDATGEIAEESDLLAHTSIFGIRIMIALNLMTRDADNDVYGTIDNPTVALYPQHMLPQAEDAYELYVRRGILGGSIYSEIHLDLLRAARKFIENGERKVPSVWAFDRGTLPILIGTGLEDRDYVRWKKLPRELYLEQCILDRAITYILTKLVGVVALRAGIPHWAADDIGEFAEIAYGPLPLARLGEYMLLDREIYDRVLHEAECLGEVDALRTDRERIISAARRIVNGITKEHLGKRFDEIFSLDLIRRLRVMLNDLSPIYLREEPVEQPRRIAPKPAGMQPERVFQLPVSLPATVTSDISPGSAEVICIHKPDVNEFIAACKNQFIGSSTEILTALHDIAKTKEIRYTIGHPENLVKLIEKYRSELKARYFDVNSALDEMATKAAKLARVG